MPWQPFFAVAIALFAAPGGDLQAQDLPAAPSVAFQDVTTTTATVAVTEGSCAGSIVIQYQADGATDWIEITSGTCAEVVGEHELTGLEPNTTYFVEATASSGGLSLTDLQTFATEPEIALATTTYACSSSSTTSGTCRYRITTTSSASFTISFWILQSGTYTYAGQGSDTGPNVSVNETFTGLAANTTYQTRARSGCCGEFQFCVLYYPTPSVTHRG